MWSKLVGHWAQDFMNTSGTHKSKFAQHLLENNHSIGPIDSIMEVLHYTRKGKLMDTFERFHIYKETRENIQINDKNTSKPKVIFDVMIRGETSRQFTKR